MKRALSIVVMLVLASCPPPSKLEGKLCDDAGRCPEGLVCFHDRCRAEACDPDELGQACTSGVGACARPGTWSCLDAQQTCNGGQGTPGEELCNGVDDDCDGLVDDSVRDAGDACFGGQGVCRGPGGSACVDGGFICQTTGPVPVPEACNGLDDDCDGFIDDGCLGTLAGSGPPGDVDGPWEDAQLHRPIGLASDSAGNLFFADSSNNKIKVARPDGGVSTIAGSGACGLVDGPALSAAFCVPWGIAVAPNGDVFVTDSRNAKVRVVRNPLGAATVETRFADAGLSLTSPRGLRFTADGGLLVADVTLHRVFWITSRGITNIGALGGGIDDGTISSVQLKAPIDAIEADDGSLFILENGSNRIRRVPRDGGYTSKFVGGSDAGQRGSTDGVGILALFDNPQAFILDSDGGRLFVTDANNTALRLVPVDPTQPTATIARLAGGPVGVARLDKDSLATTEVNMHWLRRVSIAGLLPDGGGGLVERLVSNSAVVPAFDGDASVARLLSPDKLLLWPAHGIVWLDAFAVRLLVADAGQVLTLAGPKVGDGGPDGPLFNGGWIGRPNDVKVGPGGLLFVTDNDNRTVRRIDVDGMTIDTFAGPGAPVPFTLSAPNLLAFSKGPSGEDLLFLTEGSANAPVLRRYDVQGGTRAVLAGQDSGVPISSVVALTPGPNGDVFLIDDDAFIRRFPFEGGVQPIYRVGAPSLIRGFYFDAQGRVVWARGSRVLRADPRDAGLEVLFESATYPGSTTSVVGYADGPPKVGILWNGTSIAGDGERFFLTDEANNRLRVLLPSR